MGQSFLHTDRQEANESVPLPPDPQTRSTEPTRRSDSQNRPTGPIHRTYPQNRFTEPTRRTDSQKRPAAPICKPDLQEDRKATISLTPFQIQ